MAIERAVLKGTIGDVVEIRNMFTCSVTEMGGDTSAILWDAYMDNLVDAMLVLACNTIHYYSYEVQTWNTPNWVPKDIVSIDATGDQTGDQLPNQSAVVLIAKSAGIHGVGRKFLAGLSETQQVAGTMIAGIAVDLALVLANYITPFTGIGGGTIIPGVLDKTGTFRPFVGGFVSSLLGSMRRRKPGVGI